MGHAGGAFHSKILSVLEAWRYVYGHGMDLLKFTQLEKELLAQARKTGHDFNEFMKKKKMTQSALLRVRNRLSRKLNMTIGKKHNVTTSGFILTAHWPFARLGEKVKAKELELLRILLAGHNDKQIALRMH